MLGISADGASRIRRAWERALVDSTTEIMRHLPLIVAGGIITLVQVARVKLIPTTWGRWTVPVDDALIAIEFLVLVSLGVGSAIDLLGELAERLAVIKNRVAATWRTGQRPPEKHVL